MRIAFTFTFIVVALAGCATSGAYHQMLQTNGAMHVDPAPPGVGYDYVVSLRNLVDIGFNPDDKATRDATALSLLKTQCPAGSVVGETIINTGTYATGRPSLVYALQVKCAPS
jgi:hypothetical protein